MAGFAYRLRRIVSWPLIYIIGLQPLHPAIAAGIESAQSQTKVQIHNQIPVVNIARPNASGVSHNRYSDFNVPPAGAVLNNSKTAGYSAWVGYLDANPHLAGNSAQLIINEVTSRQPSSLEGMLELFGQNANVIIANPNGLYCNGCRFIDMNAITLTTGIPVLNRLGGLDRLDVVGGAITVGEKGLNTLYQKDAAIISRTLDLQGEIYANQLDILLGANQIDYQSGHIKSLFGVETSHELAIDTRALGGMYAERIRLVSTEKGKSGNLNNISGSKGDVTLDVAGNITAGSILAKKDLNIVGKNTTITSSGELISGRDITLVNTELNNYGKVKSVGDIRIFSDKVYNVGSSAKLHAKNQIWIQKDAEGNKNTLVENKSGSIKTDNGDLIIRTEKLDNSRQVFSAGWQELTPDSREASFLEPGKTDRTIMQLPVDSHSNEMFNKWFGTMNIESLSTENMSYIFTANSARSHYKVSAISTAADIDSGKNIYLNATLLNNNLSNIEAKKDTFLTGDDFLNTSIIFGTKNIFSRLNVEIDGGGENYWANTTKIADQSQWESVSQNQGIIKSTGNLVVDFKNNINLHHQSPTESLSFDEVIIGREKQSVLQANNIVLHAKNIISNSAVHAQEDLVAIADNSMILSRADITANNIAVTALNDIDVAYSEISGQDITLISRQGNVKFNSPALRYFQQNGLRTTNQLKATGDLTIISGLNIHLLDTLLHPSKNITMTASNNITLANTATPLLHQRISSILSLPQKQALFDQALPLTGRLNAHESITLTAGENLVLQGVGLTAGQDINLHAAHDIELINRVLVPELDPFFPASRTPELSTQINAKGNLLINAGRDILSQASNISADNNSHLLAGRNIQLAALAYSGLDHPAGGQRQDRHVVTRVQTDNTLNMVAGHQLLSWGAEISSGGDMTLASGNNMRFESLLNEQHQGGGDNFSFNKLQQPTQLNSGGILTLISNGSILFQATQLAAKTVMDVAAEGGYLFAQAMEETSHAEQRWSSRKWWGRKKSHHNVQHSATNKLTEFTAGGDISLLSRDDSTYQASKIAAGQHAKLTSTHGKVIFEAVKNTTFEQKTTLSKGFYIKQSDKGYQEETWVLPSIHAGGELTVDAAQGISADIKIQNGQSLRNAVIALSNTPGNQWLKDLNLRDDVQWHKVMDAYHSWDHRSQQLNPVVAVVIAIAVAAATAGSGLVVAANAAVGGGISGGAVTAGMSSLASQAAVSLANNQGNISKTLKDLGSKSSVKSLATSMAVGGALSGFDAVIGFDSTANSAHATKLPRLSNGDWSKTAQRVAGQSIISSSLNTGINGGSFKDNLTTALFSNMGAQLHAEGAHLIGNHGTVLGAPGKALSHALVAGVAAEIGGGNAKGAAAGALAAELAGTMMGENFIGPQHWQEQQAQLSRVAGALAGALASGKAEGAYSGAGAAEVVERFNRQLHLEEIKAINELAQGNNIKQERFMAASCRQVNCSAQESLNSSERIRAEALMVKYPETPEEDNILARYWIQKEKQRFGNYPALTGFEQIQLFTYTDADKLSDSQVFAKNQWVEEVHNSTGWSKETIETLGLSVSLAASLRGRKFDQYPTGLSFNINQKNHLAKFDGFTQNSGIKGTHNADEFYSIVAQKGVKIVSSTPSDVNGITHVKYQVPAYGRAGNVVGYKAKIQIKTIYNPKIFSDQKMLELGQKASISGFRDAMSKGLDAYDSHAGGVTFRVYIDKTTGLVHNFHPK